MSAILTENLIVKYISCEASFQEIEVLTRCLKIEKNQQLFNDFITINYAADLFFSNYDSKCLKRELLKRIRKKQ